MSRHLPEEPGPSSAHGEPAEVEVPSFAEMLAGRRMCRNFLDESIPSGVLHRVLSAAFRGPAAGNTHALDLVVLEGQETSLHWDVTLPAPRRAAFAWPGLLRAPVLVEVIVDPEAYIERYSRSDKVASGLGAGTGAWGVPYWFVDGGAAVMAMLLAAEAAGLGALLFGLFGHETALLSELGVPAGRRCIGTVALGRSAPAGRAPSRSARDGRPDPEDHVHHGGWQTARHADAQSVSNRR